MLNFLWKKSVTWRKKNFYLAPMKCRMIYHTASLTHEHYEAIMLTLDSLHEQLKLDLYSYARVQNDAVSRGAETAELAGLLTQKYGYGLAKALVLAAELSDHPAPSLMADVDHRVGEIDLHWRTTFDLRI